ncbi:P-loop containing nucleoside triphosphate hydrolase protein [Trichophaea hybrida]|nr:P-loop containing nucleoside triphosphate hydrolase protein [Trichophaea hybrida]
MSKRPIEDVEAGAPTIVKAKKSKKDKSEKKSKSTDKKGTVAEDVMIENGVTKVTTTEKKEKKEKKEKGAKKEKKAKINGDTAATLETSDPSSKLKLTKEERKAAKKAAKEAAKKLAESKESTADAPVSESPTHTTMTAGAVASATATYTQSAELTAVPNETIEAFLKEHSVFIDDPHKLNLRPITNFSYLPPNAFDFTKFKIPSPIQAATWPFTLAGHDCIGVAETGSGKTLAFSVPAMRHVLALAASTKKDKLGVRVVVISPTRELAMQIFEVLEKYSKDAGLRAVCLYGGVPKDEQRKRLRNAQVIVATPGRLNDLINEGAADLSKVSYLVLDEADRMLDKGFEEDIRRIISVCPSKETRQTLMFTATWPQSVRELAITFMKKPVKITIGNRGDLRANVRIKQTVEVIDQRAKEQRLLQLIKQYQSGSNKDDRILVFCLYKKEASRVEGFLRSKGCKVAGIHGDLNQGQRTQALGQFKSGACPLLIATDVAARGLDIPAVKLVINVTFPLTIEDYVHRIGRTGRAGADGMAYTFFTEHDKAHSGSLVNILKAANQEIPESLLKFGTTVKKKEHSVYGAFFKETDSTKIATKITFDD